MNCFVISKYLIFSYTVILGIITSSCTCGRDEYDLHNGMTYEIGDKEYFSGAVDEILEFDEYIVAKQVVGSEPVPLPFFKEINHQTRRPPYPEGLKHTYYYIRNKYDNQGAGPLTYKEFLDTCKILHIRLF